MRSRHPTVLGWQMQLVGKPGLRTLAIEPCMSTFASQMPDILGSVGVEAVAAEASSFLGPVKRPPFQSIASAEAGRFDGQRASTLTFHLGGTGHLEINSPADSISVTGLAANTNTNNGVRS